MSEGYGDFHLGGGNSHVLAHRFSYELTYGPLPPKVGVDHRCSNRRCVNPEHLRPASQKQNMEHHSKLLSNNRSGFRGVSWYSRLGKWRGRVIHNGRAYDVGFFDDPSEADVAVRAKRNELFTYNDEDRVDI